MKKYNKLLTTAFCALSMLASSAAEPSPGYLDLNGNDRYMSIEKSADFDIAKDGSQTVTLDVMLDHNLINGELQSIIGNRYRRYQNNNNNDVSGFEIYNLRNTSGNYNSTGHVYPSTSWSASNINANNSMNAGAWTHLALVHNGAAGMIYYYIDGRQVGSVATKNLALPCYADILVGCRYNLDNNTVSSITSLSGFTHARIDNLRIYSSALNAEQVIADNNSDTPLDGIGIIAAYNFDDITGNTVYDISGNGHNGTLAGTWPEYGAPDEEATLNINCNDGGTLKVTLPDGTIVSSGDIVPTGKEITVQAIPYANYELKTLSLNGNALTVDNDSKATFTINGNSTLSAKFAYSDAGVLKVPVFSMNENGSKYYRIPALVLAADGSLVAAADQRGSALNDLPNTISIVTKRSTDGGRTWSDMTVVAQGNSATGKTYGDPAIVSDRATGRIMLIYSGDNGFWASTRNNRAGFYYSISSDNGQTWSEPVSFTDQVYQTSWRGAFASSGNAVQLSSGRIMFVANAHCSDTWGVTTYCYACYSDDFGLTWHVANSNQTMPADALGNEAKIIELANGDLLMSIRSSGSRRFSRSTDGGTTWSAAYSVNDLPDPSCNGDIIRFPSIDGRNRILHSLPNHSSIRQDVSVALSYDEGETWPVKKQLIDGYSAYSSLAVLPDGSIGCLVEEGKWDSNLPGEDGFNLYFMRFTLDWLTDGNDTYNPSSESDKDAPIFITIGQSNADGSAFFNSTIDAAMQNWYSAQENNDLLKIWYRSTQVQNQSSNSLGEAARWVIDGTTTDVEPGWLNLWYRNENTQGRTAMNMIHGYGTYSVGSGTDCAQGRRGMEGEFGIKFSEAYPQKPLYVIKLGVSGSFISSWANEQDDHNWNYFYNNMFKPAIESLLAQGKRPRLAGIWWMQGCADSSKDKVYYKECLERLIERCRSELGFEQGKFYIGHIVKPGESTVTPSGSVSFSQNVRDAQDEVAQATEGVEIIDTKNCPMQYESNFNGYIHFSHEGVNAIGDLLAEKVIADGPDNWNIFTTPGKWQQSEGRTIFVPSVGNPDITYSQEGSVITATITYPGWTELKTYDLSESTISSPGYLELDGIDRFMRIDKDPIFDIPQGGSQTVTLKLKLDHIPAYGETQSIIGNRIRHYQNNNNNDVSGFEIYNLRNNNGTYNSTAHWYPSTSWSAANINANNSMSAGVWTHLALVHDGAAGMIYYYIDGQKAGSVATKNLALPCYADILVGCRYNVSDQTVSSIDNIGCFTHGDIDDLRIYSTALSADQVSADATAGAPLDDAGVIAAYDFSRISNSMVTDISGNGHTGYLIGSWPAYTPTFTVTIEEPENGTLTILNGDVEINSGDRVEENSVLTITATPAEGYELATLTANDAAIEGNTLTLTEDVTIAATFSEVQPSYETFPADISSTYPNRYTSDISLTCEGETQQITNLQRYQKDYVYKDATNQIASFYAGKTVTVTANYNGSWMHGYLWIDYNKDYQFTPDMNANDIPTETSELVGFTNFNRNESGTWHASDGTKYSDGGSNGAGNADKPITFTLPADLAPGDYRARFIVDWNAIEPNPDPNRSSNKIQTNGGIVADFTIRIVEKTSFKVAANVTGGAASIEINGEGGFQTLPAKGMDVAKNAKVAVRFVPAASHYDLTSFEVNGVDETEDMSQRPNTIYSIASVDQDYTFNVVYTARKHTLTVINPQDADPMQSWFGEFRDNNNEPLSMLTETTTEVEEGTSVFFVVMPPLEAAEEGEYELETVTDNGADVKDDMLPMNEEQWYIMGGITEDHTLVVTQSLSGIIAISSDANNALKLENDILTIAADDAVIEVADITGRVLRKAQTSAMEVSDLVKGVYVAKAVTADATYTLKFIKL